MHTIEEYQVYCKQLEQEVDTWLNAYKATRVERDELVRKVLDLEGQINRANAIIAVTPKQDHNTEIDTLASGIRNLNEVINAMSDELEELRKHELAWDLDKARIKELESEINQLKGNFSEAVKLNGELQKTA